MNGVVWFIIYGMILLNVYTWIIWPEFLLQGMWKWEIFVMLLYAPLIYKGYKDERKN